MPYMIQVLLFACAPAAICVALGLFYAFLMWVFKPKLEWPCKATPYRWQSTNHS